MSDFHVGQKLKVVALQGDWGVSNHVGAEGGRFLIDDRSRAVRLCTEFLGRVNSVKPDLALVPELAIPRESVPAIVESVKGHDRDIVFIGGIEGLTKSEYEAIGHTYGSAQSLATFPSSGYVNAMLMIVKTASTLVVRLRAKRVPSRPENVGPPLALGAGPFTVLKLGAPSVVIVPLICAEFVWPEGLWKALAEEVDSNIDVVPVIQRNTDPDAHHTSPELHRAFTEASRVNGARFIFANQAYGKGCDGTSYVIVPPNSPADPSFDHARYELWHLPGVRTYKGFRIPDISGCVWTAEIVRPHTGSSALGNRLCEGAVLEVFAPAVAPISGVAAGLMRTAAIRLGDALVLPVTGAHDSPVLFALEALTQSNPRFVLSGSSTASAQEVLFKTHTSDWPSWKTVEGIVSELVESAALMSAAGDAVCLQPCDGGNCTFDGKPLAVLFAPNVDRAIEAFLSTGIELDGGTLPLGLVLIGVTTGTSVVDARRVGDVSRADRITSRNEDYTGIPTDVTDNAVVMRPDQIEFRTLIELKPNLSAPTSADARVRIESLYSRVYS